MGILRFVGTILKHPAINDAVFWNVPNIECLLIDYNANIHYILDKIITELNEILYFTKHKNITDIQFEFDRNLALDELEELMDWYQMEYDIGNTYEEIKNSLIDNEKINDILFCECIRYTRRLIASLNTGNIKKVYLVLDGVPSMAKMKEQKNRRYIGAYLNNIKQDIVKRYKMSEETYQIDLFKYRTQICAGTDFIENIQHALLNLDIGMDIEVSTVHIKGEGEKKIIHIMEEVSQYESYCVMSPDSDMLILLGLLEKHPDYQTKKIYNFRIDYQNKNQYQFIDLSKLLDNLYCYYKNKLCIDFPKDNMRDVLFLLVVFGNDFLPKLEPLNIILHFDYICETCLELASTGFRLIGNQNLNYRFLLNFFRKINQKVISLSIEQYLNDTYYNFSSLCKKLSISKAQSPAGKDDLSNNHQFSISMETLLEPVQVNYQNFSKYVNIVKEEYGTLINFVRKSNIISSRIKDLYRDISFTQNGLYLLLVMPRIVKFPGANGNTDSFTFFQSFINYIQNNRHSNEIKLMVKLMRNNLAYKFESVYGGLTDYLYELEKFNKSMDPYKSLFKIEPVVLAEYNLENGKTVDLQWNYYKKYIGNKCSPEKIACDYLVGIEWLYQYYVLGKHHEWSGWFYAYSKPPLIRDLVKYLEKHPNCQPEFDSVLSSYPENTMGPKENYLQVTPNDYTGAGITCNLEDVLDHIDGYGALYLNRCQIKWHEL